MITWTWVLAIYLWVAGIAGGGYCAAFLADRFSGRKHKELLQIATWIGVPLVLLGSLLLVFDLGHPPWLWHVFVRFLPISPMSLGSWILFAWAVIGVALIALWFAEIFEPTEQPADVFAWVASLLRPLVPATEILSWIAFVLAILLIAYTGVLLSATNQPLWSRTFLLPALFVASALSTGIAALVVALLVKGPTLAHTLAFLGRADPVVNIIELVTLAALLVWLGPAGKLITTGTLGFFFWVGAVLIGMLVPLGLGLRAIIQDKEGGFEALLSALWNLTGGLILRAVMLLGGQIYG